MHDKKLFGTATVGTKGQVVIPADARQALGIETGDRLYVVGSAKSGAVAFLPEEKLREMIAHFTSSVDSFKDILEKTDKE